MRTTPALRLNLALVRRMHEVCRERGITFLVAAFPGRDSYRVKPRLAERFLRSLDTEGIKVVDVSVHLRTAGPRFKAVALDGTGHLNPLGHSLASEVLEAEIARDLERNPATSPLRRPRPVERQRVAGR